MRLNCTNCSHLLRIPDDALGRKARCGHCGHKFVLTARLLEGARADRPTPAKGVRTTAAATRGASAAAVAGRSAKARSTEPAPWSSSAVGLAVEPAPVRPAVDELEILPPQPRVIPGLQPERTGAPRRGPAALPRLRAPRRDLVTEGHLRAISFWDRVNGILMFLFGAGFLALGATAIGSGGFGGRGMMLMAGLTGAVASYLLGIGAAFYTMGHFLWRYHNWARWVVTTVAGLLALRTLLGLVGSFHLVGLIFTGIGLAWYGAMIYVLTSPAAAEVCSEEYRERVAASREDGPAWWTSPFFYLPLGVALLGLGFVGLTLLARG